MSEIIPPTFFLDFEDDNLDFNIKHFLNFYFKNLPLSKVNETPKTFLNLNRLQTNLSLTVASYKEESLYVSPIMSDVFLNGNSYLWFFKPNGLNRGRGIKVFNKIEELENFLNETMRNEDENRKNGEEEKFKIKSDNNKKIERLIKSYQVVSKKKKNKFESMNKIFVIQKYIEKPLLINQRKFDIRVWSLITHTLDFYFFKYFYCFFSQQIE